MGLQCQCAVGAASVRESATAPASASQSAPAPASAPVPAHIDPAYVRRHYTRSGMPALAEVASVVRASTRGAGVPELAGRPRDAAP